MTKSLRLLIGLFLCFSVITHGQQVIYNFETDSTTTNFQYFGSSIDGSLASVVANPAPDAENGTDSVLMYVKPAGAQTWAGAFANPGPTGLDLSTGGTICIDVWMDHIGNFALKLEQSPNGGADWITTQENTVVNAWEQLCFDLSANAIEGTMEPAAGNIYNGLVIFADFGTDGGASDVTYFVDEIVYNQGSPYNTTVIFDQEDTASTGTFQYFGSRLDGQLTETIANPDPTGINTSDNVIKYVKPEDSQIWAGAFSNPDPVMPVDASNGGMICVQVHMDHIGSFSVKLENSTTGGGNWITTVPNTKVNEWEELCFPFDSLSIEDPIAPATGHVYQRIVFFADFGTAGNGTDTSVYYLDNFSVKTPAGNNSYDVTFELDMNEYTGTGMQPYVSGSFNTWCGDCNPMDDSDGDGIWTAVINIPQGPAEYKFTIDNWEDEEMFNGMEECTVTDPSGQFTNRSLLVTNATETQSFCWNSCYKCGESATITFNVNTALLDSVSTEGIFLAGGEAFGHGDFPLSDSDGDGIWSLTIERGLGFKSDYTFINGICLPDWGCKENIAGQACAVAPFNDRRLDTLQGDVVINTCFGACTDDGSCPNPGQEYAVTFNVDMNDEDVTGGVFIAGNIINNWCADCNAMDDGDGDGIYTATIMLPAGIHEFKYINGAEWETLTQGDPCTITDPSGDFTNRLLLLEEADTTLAAVKFGSCDLTPTKEYEIDESLYELKPTLVADATTLTWDISNLKLESVELYRIDGQLVSRTNLTYQSGVHTIDMSDLNAGMYMVVLRSADQIGVQKVLRIN